MKRWTFLYLLAFLGWSQTTVVWAVPAIQATSPHTQEHPGTKVYDRAGPAVVMIIDQAGSGSGSLVSPTGLVLTNEHVVRHTWNGRVVVQISNGQRYQGQVVATDHRHDLALVQLRTNGRFPYLRLAEAKGIRVGQPVYAIGSPFGRSGTLTAGILNRIDPNGDLQTDAVLNPGNSGGPLLNSQGELVGINKAILVGRDGRSTGIGFATNVWVAEQFIVQHQRRFDGDHGIVVRPSTMQLGVVINTRNLVVEKVQPGSIASRVGLQPGDRIVAINGRRLRNFNDLQTFLDQYPSSAVVTIARSRSLANVRINF